MSQPAAGEPRARFLRACRRLPVDRTPVWFMRQAGRYMPEYRALREKHSLLDLCRNPELAAEVTLQPVRALGVDAAILFADILLPLIPLGANLRFEEGRGPVIDNPLRGASDLARLRPVEVERDLEYVLQEIKLLRRELPDEVPLIGFAGAPFTVGCYLIEGGGSRSYAVAKALMYADSETWHALMQRLSDLLARYLLAQIEAGAQAVQLFDSWVGALSPQDYRDYVQPHSAELLERVSQAGVPVIHFGTATANLLQPMRQAGGSVLGVDWRIPLDQAWERIGYDRAVQGNLDPTVLFAPAEVLERQVRRVLRQADGRTGHIFNLGHGILPGTPVESVKAVVELVHQISLMETEATAS